MLVFDAENWPRHRPWAVATAVAALAALAWCLAAAAGSPGGRWPSGGSWPGLTLGIVGGLICVFEMLLWPRKLLRRMRLGRTKHWMAAHLWLGVLALPILLMHGGFRLDPSGSTLAVVLMWLVLAVVASGIYGGIMQATVPKRMLSQLPAETITAQIPRVLELYREEARALVDRTCGDQEVGAGGEYPSMESAVMEVVRTAGQVSGKVVETIATPGAVAGAAALREFHEEIVDPYLKADRRAAGRQDLVDARRAAETFREIRLRLPAGAHAAVDRLADLCEQRRQFDRQIALDRHLRAWLVFHFVLSMALLCLLAAHTVLALRYR